MSKILSDNVIRQEHNTYYVNSAQVLYDLLEENELEFCYNGLLSLANNELSLMYLEGGVAFYVTYKPGLVPYETHFEDGTEITDYLACAYAEGFCEGCQASGNDIIKAWSYIAGKNLHRGLQGWYGRTVHYMIETGVMKPNGFLNWDKIS